MPPHVNSVHGHKPRPLSSRSTYFYKSTGPRDYFAGEALGDQVPDNTNGRQSETYFNPSCDLPKEVEATSEHKESNLDLESFGSDSMNRFW